MNPERPSEVVVDADESDFRRILRDRGRKTIRNNRISLLFELIVIILTAIATLVIVGLSDRIMLTAGLLFILVFVLNLLVYAAFLWSIRSQAREQANSETPITYLFTSKGVTSVSKSIATESSWARFVGVKETESDILLFVTNDKFIAIPKRFLTEGDEMSKLTQLIVSNATGKVELIRT